jgi:hypothetical protein
VRSQCALDGAKDCFLEAAELENCIHSSSVTAAPGDTHCQEHFARVRAQKRAKECESKVARSALLLKRYSSQEKW